MLSKQGADPRRKRGDCGEDHKQLQQLAFDVEPVFFPFHHMCRFGVIMLEEVKFQKQKVVDESHVADLIDRKDQHESQIELPKRKAASDAVPDGDHAQAEDHQNADDEKRPSDGPGPVEEFFLSLHQNLSCFLRGRAEELIILNKGHAGYQHQSHRSAEYDCKKYR